VTYLYFFVQYPKKHPNNNKKEMLFIMAENKLYNLEEVRKIIPLSKAGIYKACKEGTIPSLKIGKRVFVPSWYIDKMLNEPTGAQ
jgi:predicted DNA-binding transcriptional regulator AlpA